MVERIPRNILIIGATLVALALAYVAYSRPGYFTNTTYLMGLLFLEFMALAIWMYRRIFFVVVLVSFLFAGVNLPVGGGWAAVRWMVLGVGTLVGLLIMLKDRNYRFGFFHLVAFFAAITGLISAAVSAYPDVALLKVLSMLLLFAYAATGARIAAIGRENSFFGGLLLGCEILVGLSAIFYAMGIEAMGNPNSLGAIMGVVASPILLWGVLLGGAPWVYRRRVILYALCTYMIFMSHARAAVAAAIISSAVLCLALRKYKLLIEGFTVLAIVIAAVALVRPEALSSTTSSLVYKNREEGILASRISPWQSALNNFNDHPWFGMGLGTTIDGAAVGNEQSKIASSGLVTAENGSSYLSLLVGVGVVGTIPFAILLVLIVIRLVRTVLYVHSFPNAMHPAIPLATVVIAAILHAAFEDWMFAPGNYICVFFWCVAFLMNDIAPPSKKSALSYQWVSNHKQGAFGGIAPAP